MATEAVDTKSGAAAVFDRIRQQQQAKTANKELGKDEFLKLLTYQMKAQNPLKPQDGQEFAAQLAQFSQLEQLANIKQLLADQSKASLFLTQTVANSSAPSFIGKTARATVRQVYSDGSTPIDFGWNFDENQQSASVEIKTPAGALIRSYELTPAQIRAGEHNIQWDGKNNRGESVGAGKYVVSIKATPSTGGSPVAVLPFINGKITAVKFRADGSVAVINGSEIPLSDILDVSI